MSIENILAGVAVEAVKELYGAQIDAAQVMPQATKKEFEGNLTIVVFPLLRASHKAPDVTATELGNYLVAHCDAVEKFNVIKGFLNITLKPTYWTSVLTRIATDDNYGYKPVTADRPLVMTE